jgi:Bacterial sugar transferase
VWTRDCLREVALADLGCAVAGVFAAARFRFGSDVAQPYRILGLVAAGAHLRRRPADELPQLFNVFLGRMSLVGPQPTCGMSGAC